MATKSLQRFFPFLEWLPKLTKQTLSADVIAGLTGTIIVIPQAVAFAMIAGLPPIYGFYTSMITPIIAALFGSSYHLISGPTTAISIVVFTTISQFADPMTEVETYVALTLVLTFLSGLIQFLMGVVRLGKLVNFVSHSVIIGFTAGAGILIAFKQLKHVFGIDVPQGSSLFEIVTHIGSHISDTNWYVFGVAIGTLVSALIIKRFLPKFYMLLAMVVGSILAIALGGETHGIETVGKIPSHLPPFRVPEFTLENIKQLAPGAGILAILGLVEAVAIGRAIGLHTHQKINGNQEFIGQGLSNMVASFFSSYAGSGSFTRSGVNHQAGAKTPMAAIFAALFLMLVLLFVAPLAAYLPKPAMGGIILLVGYNLIDIHHIKQVIRSSKRELVVLLVTLLGTMFIPELEYALLAGIFFSFLFYLERTSNPNVASMAITQKGHFINIVRDDNLQECPQLKIVRLDGSIYFGSLEVISNYFSNLFDHSDYDHVLVIARGVNFIDLAGAEWLTHEAKKWQGQGGGLYFVNLKLVAQDVLRAGGFYEKIGAEHFYPDKRTAVASIYHKLDKDICASCQVHVFKECQEWTDKK